MGLDMYLNRSHYRRRNGKIGTHKYFNSDYEKKCVENNQYKDVWIDDEFECSNFVTIKEEIGFWRRAYSIHRWFCENTEYNDDNVETMISESEIMELYDIVTHILELAGELKWRANGNIVNNNPKNLMNDVSNEVTEKGFRKNTKAYKDFVEYCDEHLRDYNGVQNYDYSYLWEVAKTKLMLERVIKDIDDCKKRNEIVEYSYRAC